MKIYRLWIKIFLRAQWILSLHRWFPWAHFITTITWHWLVASWFVFAAQIWGQPYLQNQFMPFAFGAIASGMFISGIYRAIQNKHNCLAFLSILSEMNICYDRYRHEKNMLWNFIVGKMMLRPNFQGKLSAEEIHAHFPTANKWHQAYGAAIHQNINKIRIQIDLISEIVNDWLQISYSFLTLNFVNTEMLREVKKVRRTVWRFLDSVKKSLHSLNYSSAACISLTYGIFTGAKVDGKFDMPSTRMDFLEGSGVSMKRHFMVRGKRELLSIALYLISGIFIVFELIGEMKWTEYAIYLWHNSTS